MEEGADGNELESGKSELEIEKTNDEITVQSSGEELVKTPVHNDDTAIEEKPDEGRTTAVESAEAGSTGEPGGEPTGETEGEPTGEPGEEPKGEPGEEPTGEPTGEPEGEPTGEPGETTGEPTGEPGEEPKGEPEGEPTGEPEGEPTGETETKGEPTGEPEGEPTGEPTGEPEGEPTGEPEGKPTGEPEGKPTGEPEGKPTGEPEGEPTGEPEEKNDSDSALSESPGAGEPSSGASHEEGGGEKETPVEEEVEPSADDSAYARLYDQLCAEREKLIRYSGQLQTKLAEDSDFWKDAGADGQSAQSAQSAQSSGPGDAQPERERSVSHPPQQSYEMCLTQLGDLKLKEQALQTQEKLLQRVDAEWQELVALKRHAAVTAPGRHTGGKRAARAADEVLAREQRRADELAAARLADGEKEGRAPQTGASGKKDNVSDMLPMLEQQKTQKERQVLWEKYDEDLLKIRRNIAGSMEVMVHSREDLQWIQAENQAKRAQLAQWEGAVAQKRDLLTGAKRARNRLRSHALELKHHCGMLGDVVLLRDFEDQTDACGQLEGDAGDLCRRQHETALKCERWKKKLGKS